MIALVPFRDGHHAKSRLAPVCSIAERRAFARSAARHVVDVLRTAQSISEVWVVGQAGRTMPDVPPLNAAQTGAPIASDLNADLHTALGRHADPDEPVLVVAADLPLLAIESAFQLAAALRDTDMVIAPDRWRTGTNAIGYARSRQASFAFGTSSFAQHCRVAETTGLSLHVHMATDTGLDVDTPQDLVLARLETADKEGLVAQ
jgi:2-phospho-L-lactate guanylyltransferase